MFGVGFWTIWTQFFPPKNGAPITAINLPNQAGKVFVVTGGSSGLRFELAKILYGASGKVYILSRTKSNVKNAIKAIEDSFTNEGKDSLGKLEYIQIGMADLESVRTAAREFTQKETRLDVLFNNAGLASITKKTKQGLEHMLRVNTKSPANSVRVVWSASILTEIGTPKGGVRIDRLDNPSNNRRENYSVSKCGNWFVASEFARREGQKTGVVSIAGNPGNYLTNVWRSTPGYMYYPFWPLVRDPINDACPYLWLGFSKDVTMDDAIAGRYETCDGRWHPGQRKDLVLALKGEEEGGTGQARAFLDWCQRAIAPFSILEPDGVDISRPYVEAGEVEN
ncbi:NAD(P)-binding protein [Lentithecium fluviatile CBS 122367]|uniref:NAD(P)-binding protein n=1 Tax=Lentithecium fluviatile CBS 122367 TaxID=1168545 RepID=A0A6G1II72_9PLEO|nr:NAD(P)-binding protein [Lentithecium fluviatile CBS 122367]